MNFIPERILTFVRARLATARERVLERRRKPPVWSVIWLWAMTEIGAECSRVAMRFSVRSSAPPDEPRTAPTRAWGSA
jgi:hypothetical protein